MGTAEKATDAVGVILLILLQAQQFLFQGFGVLPGLFSKVFQNIFVQFKSPFPADNLFDVAGNVQQLQNCLKGLVG